MKFDRNFFVDMDAQITIRHSKSSGKDEGVLTVMNPP
jgi:hypothetical protein